MTDTALFRLTAIVWWAGLVARIVLFASGSVELPGGRAGTLAGLSVGGAAGLVIGLLHWFRPTHRTALLGILFGFYAVVAITLIPSIGLPPWAVLLEVLGLLAIGLSALCWWRTREAR